MNIIEPTNASDLAEVTPGVSSDEWITVQATRANVLLIGEEQEVDDAVRVLQALVRQPIACCRASALTLTPDFDGSFVLRDAENLSVVDQQRMLDWLSETQRPRQVITTCSTSLFSSVQLGAFSEALYYRLNMLTFLLGPRAAPAILGDVGQ